MPTFPFLAPRCALLAELLQPAAQEGDAPAGQAPVGLELRLTRATGAYAAADVPQAAAEPFEVLPHPPHARQVVFELSELDLELALGAARMLGEDVEDQLGAIDDPCGQRIFEPALLGRAELVVDEQGLGPGRLELRLQLVELPLAYVAALIGFRSALDELADRLDAGRTRELA